LEAGVELITNGLLLDDERVQRLRQLDLDRLWLSVDGGMERCYGHTMDREEFTQLVQTLWRSDTVHHFPLGRKLRLGLVFVAMKSNVHQLPEVMGLARQLHASRVLISNLLPYGSELSKEVLYSKSMWNTASDHLQVSVPRVDLGAGVLECLGKAMGHQDMTDLLGREYEGPFNTCPFIRTGSMSVRWDGGVSPCLPLLHTHVSVQGDVTRRSRECLFGSLQDHGLLEIWRRPEYVAFRQRVAEFGFPPCASCDTCELAEHNEQDCYGNPFPTCGGCLWAQGLVLCP
ncbi:SPASM domain-containing protein, partial [Candidatus Latescibacterota bacterium]